MGSVSGDLIKKAFVLAAGLGTRLRPLTDQLPKPLIPVGLKPLITFAFDHLIADAGVEEFIVNTHHRAEAFADGLSRRRATAAARCISATSRCCSTPAAASATSPTCSARSRKRCSSTTATSSPTCPSRPAIAHHRASGNEVTLVLRSQDGPKHIAWDPASGRVLDIRNRLGTGAAGRVLPSLASTWSNPPSSTASRRARSSPSSRSFWT